MKDREPYRKYLVCFNQDSDKGISRWMNYEELKQTIMTDQVTLLQGKKYLTEDEIFFLKIKFFTENPVTGDRKVVGNEELMKALQPYYDTPISRNHVRRMRKEVGRKLGLKGGW